MQEALTFASAAPFVALIIQLILKPLAPDFINGTRTPIVAFAVACLWGALLWTSGLFTGNAAEFIFLAVNVAAAAAGVKTWVFDVPTK